MVLVQAATLSSDCLSNSLALASQSDHSAPRRHCDAEERLSSTCSHGRLLSLGAFAWLLCLSLGNEGTNRQVRNFIN